VGSGEDEREVEPEAGSSAVVEEAVGLSFEGGCRCLSV